MRKGQAAMEFLMTYGWAILVVLAAIGALAYFGVLSPSRFLPPQCVIEPPLSCLEHSISAEDNSLSLVIQNNAGYDIIVESINITSTECNDEDTSMAGDVVENGKKVGGGVITLDCSEITEKQRVKADIKIIYKQVGGELTHIVTGTVQGRAG